MDMSKSFFKPIFTFLFIILTNGAAQEYSLSFDGVDDYVELNPIDLSSSNNLTLMCWVNPSDLTSEVDNAIIRQDCAPPNWLLAFSDNGATISFHLGNTTGTFHVLGPS